jgi:uncharacterized membrane protein
MQKRMTQKEKFFMLGLIWSVFLVVCMVTGIAICVKCPYPIMYAGFVIGGVILHIALLFHLISEKSSQKYITVSYWLLPLSFIPFVTFIIVPIALIYEVIFFLVRDAQNRFGSKQ